ncbi:MAG: hypothetical protein ACNA8W_15240, partial [Bradymonadaceae bacterium]
PHPTSMIETRPETQETVTRPVLTSNKRSKVEEEAEERDRLMKMAGILVAGLLIAIIIFKLVL